MNIVFFLAVILLVIWLSGFAFAKTEKSPESFTAKFLPLIESVKSQYPFDVPTPLILAVIKKESGSLYLTKQNSEVIGDKSLRNKAYGFMQVRLPALTDVNNAFNLGFTISDLQRDEFKNITAGIAYLQLGRNASMLSGVFDIDKFTAKKYNAGVNISFNSSLGKTYSNNVSKFMNEFTGLLA